MVWGPSGRVALEAIATRGDSLADLALPGAPGIEATSVIRDLHVVPGLHKVDGYTALIRMIEGEFEIVTGATGDLRATNFVEFRYDWRQDNRVSAQRLDTVVGDHLKRWQRFSGATDAKAILIAHSMGGLVSRYWLECMGGWSSCRALISFGTPYRGSLSALDYLANGYKKLFLDLTAVLRSFPSAHQLLPIYKAVKTGGEFRRVSDCGPIPGIDSKLAADARRFHMEIQENVEKNRRSEAFQANPYLLVPIVGTRQPTMQSAFFAEDRLTVHEDMPSGINALFAGGDGTVPRVSATPLEMSSAHRETFRPEHHSSLQANRTLLEEVADRLRDLQAGDLGTVRGVREREAIEEEPPRRRPAALSVEVDDAYLADEPVRITARLLDAEVAAGAPRAKIEAADGGTAPKVEIFVPDGEGWEARVALPPGDYRAAVDMPGLGQWSPPAVHDVFSVFAPSS